MRVKTARNKEKQTTFLPVISPCYEVTGVNWFEAFVITRKHLVLDDFPALDSRASASELVMLPSSGSLGSEYPEKVSTRKVTDGLHYLMGKVFPSEVYEDCTSHSLIATVLTYLGTAGVDPAHAELLGYHLTQHFSAVNHQRNALAGPIRFMCTMLNDIVVGKFDPSACRDRMYPEAKDRMEVVDKLCAYTGLSMDGLCEVFLGCTLQHMSTSPSMKDLLELWELVCKEPSSLSGVTISEAERAEPDEEKPENKTDEAVDVESSIDDSSDSGSESAEEALAKVAEISGSGIRNVSGHAVMGSF